MLFAGCGRARKNCAGAIVNSYRFCNARLVLKYVFKIRRQPATLQTVLSHIRYLRKRRATDNAFPRNRDFGIQQSRAEKSR